MRLTEKIIDATTKGDLYDGRGLILRVRSQKSKRWVLSYQKAKKRKEISLGIHPIMTLDMAREKMLKQRRLIAEGVEPIVTKRSATRNNFRSVAKRMLKVKSIGWTSKSSWDNWTNLPEDYIYPVIGDKDISDLKVADIAEVLEPIWYTKNATACHVRQKICAVIDYAIVMGLAKPPNIAKWSGNLSYIFKSPSKVAPVQHHRSMDPTLIQSFMQQLKTKNNITSKALEFLIHTACRSNEVRLLQWGDIDSDNKICTIPAERMKGRKIHTIPLTDAALNILGDRKNNEDLVFIKADNNVISTTGFRNLLSSLNADCTAHGFRSTFTNWANDYTDFNNRLIEHALAHQLTSKVESAYSRSTALNKRRHLMQAWSDYLEGEFEQGCEK